ncbi:MAG: hypothetical protein OIF57_04650 [Marinobacterium sp.]|nr:hypothetical protein [Marinobacterium sp.]
MANIIGELRVVYTELSGEVAAYDLVNWREGGLFITGYTYDGFRPFLRERINHYYVKPDPFDICTSAPLTPLKPPKPPKTIPVVVFTGFAKADKARLVAQAKEAGLTTSSNRAVSGNTDCLVCGPKAGPAKLKKAEELGVVVVNETEFQKLLETGELLVSD